jgi:hypothetical protein
MDWLMVIAGDIDPNVASKEAVCDKRALVQRRAKPTAFLSRHWLIGRRRDGRRAGEDIDIYVDRYTIFEWLIVLGVFVLSIADLILTLIHLSHGGAEANPIMALAFRGGNVTFGTIKMGVTAACLILLLIHIRFRRMCFFLAFSFLLYAGVFLYHRALPFIVH